MFMLAPLTAASISGFTFRGVRRRVEDPWPYVPAMLMPLWCS